MAIVIRLDDYRTKRPTKTLSASNADNVIRVAFGGANRIRVQLEEMAALPEPSLDDLGLATIHSDGRSVTVLEAVKMGDGELGWDIIATFDEDKLRRYLFKQRAVRNRLQRRIKRAECEHEFGRERCSLCGEPRPRKYRICGRRPRTWVAAQSAYKHTPRCRRREGHEGDCSWKSDPGSRE